MTRENRLIRKYSNWWIKWLGLGFWNITLRFSDKKIKRKGRYRYAIGWTDWRYLDTLIIFYPKNMIGFTKQKIEHIVLHELIHSLINEMRSKGLDHEERVVTQLQKAFSWVKRKK